MRAADARPVVLVVDDAPSTLGLLCEALEQEGYTVLVACDGESALARLALVTPDVILLDALMPGLSGFETCRRIKADAGTAQIPVIFMTGLTETPHVLEGFACGGVDYVTKPLRTPEVLVRLRTHARNAGLARLARAAVDVAGHGVLMLDAHRRIGWHSPQAMRWLGALGVQAGAATWPQAWDVAPATERDIPYPSPPGTPPQRLMLRHLGTVGLDETMLLLALRSGEASAAARLAAAALTAREAEVLSWVAKGKTNRDIADILGISPRTVNKHLEHLFEKLGVETRSAASALAAG